MITGQQLEVRGANYQTITMFMVLRGKIEAPDLGDRLLQFYVTDNHRRGSKRHAQCSLGKFRYSLICEFNRYAGYAGWGVDWSKCV